MPELTKEQKKDLKNWEKKQRMHLLIFVVLFFVILPILLLVFDIGTLHRFKISLPSEEQPISLVILIIILTIILIKIHYYKRCPNCGSRITQKDIWGKETIVVFSLPEKCNKCGVRFK